MRVFWACVVCCVWAMDVQVSTYVPLSVMGGLLVQRMLGLCAQVAEETLGVHEAAVHTRSLELEVGSG